MIKKITATTGKVFSYVEWLVFLLLVGVFLVVVSPILPFENIPKTYVVTTGSMEPSIQTGSIALTVPIDVNQLQTQDIIAFKSPQNGEDVILHRIDQIAQDDPKTFQTKGDNNNGPDSWQVTTDQVLGKYVFHLPYLGHAAAFMRTPWGFGLMVVLPALAIVISQLFNIKKAINQEVDKKLQEKLAAAKSESSSKSDKDKPSKSKKNVHRSLAIIFLMLNLANLGVMEIAKAEFSDQATISGIELAVKDFVPPETPQNLRFINPNVLCGGYTNSYTITPDWDDATDSGGGHILRYEYQINYPRTNGTRATWTTFVTNSQYTGVFNAGQGKHIYKVRAYDDSGNVSAWSEECSITYDSIAPVVTINNLTDDQSVTGNVTVNASIVDDNLSHYWLVVEDNQGNKVLGPGTTVKLSSINDEDIFTFDSTALDDGFYTIKLEARDLAGNKQPDQAPVPNDPEEPADSVDWKRIVIANNAQPATVVINEVYYYLASDEDEDKNEWVELYNNSTQTVNLKDWQLKTKSGTTKTINANVDLPPGGFVLLSHDNNTWKDWSEPASAVTINLGGSGEWLNNSGEEYLQLFDKSGQEVDFVAWGGYDDWDLNSGQGGSIARNPLGHDTDAPDDWVLVSNPNPGTNPHSHIIVDLDQDEQNLLISFRQATGFDEVEYAVNYDHVANDQTQNAQAEGTTNKETDAETLEISPIYLGTCSDAGLVCVPHQEITNLTISLLYKNEGEIIGTSTFNYDWQNEEDEE